MSQIAPERGTTVFIGAHVDHGTRDQLRALAREEERSISAILRRALRHELERTHTEEDGR
jgi:predicted transcriptional regulator